MPSATEQEAYDLLEKLAISYNRVDHPAITSVKNLAIELPGPQVKNLVLKAKKGSAIYLVILPDEKQADLKQLADQLEEKRLSFVSEEQLQTLLGISAGTVTPLALTHDTDHKVTVVIDRSIDHHDTVGFHPNTNTTTLMIAYTDFEKLLSYLGYEPLYVSL